jgi:hypothetical protein
MLILGCNSHKNRKLEFALENSGENKQELQKVLTFYNNKVDDTLKFKAAVFLIENLVYYGYNKPKKEFNSVFDSIEKYPLIKDYIYRQEVFSKLLDSISVYPSKKSSEMIRDVNIIKADFLIDNIELAFKAWYRIPKNKRASFEEFCNYILPYRCTNEPLINNSRKKLYDKYSWVYSYVDKGVSLEAIVDSVKSSFGYTTLRTMGNYYKVPLSIDQVEKSRIGKCDDGVNYYVNVFRALGIVSARDFVEHWGNNPSSNGHSWIYTKLGKEEYQTDVHRKSNIKGIYKSESIPKVFRSSYEVKLEKSKISYKKDVTDEYVLSLDVAIDDIFDLKIKEASLNVFDKSQGWFSVDSGLKNGNKFDFKNIGFNVLYLPMNKEKTQAINYPFFINKEKEINVYKPNENILDSIIITRKLGLSSRRYRKKIQWMKNLNEGVFEAADNPEFNNSKILYKISNFKSTHLKRVKIDSYKKFKYLRFRSNKAKSFLAKLAFYDSNMNSLKGNIIEKNILKEKEDYEYGAFDENVLTYDGGDYFELGYSFKNPKKISYIEFQARNDDNHINKGENYELFYWDRNWKSLGKQQAKDTLLIYKNIPKNSLLWLRNLTKGKEEHVFTIDEYNKQKWLGFENK